MKIKLIGQVDSKITDYTKKYPGTTHFTKKDVFCRCANWSNLGILSTTLSEKARRSLKIKTCLKIIFSLGIALAFKRIQLDREAAKTGIREDSIYTPRSKSNPVTLRLEALFSNQATETSMDTAKSSQLSNLAKFYLNLIPNSLGLYLKDIWSLSLDAKESNHDFIQWLFPSFTPSGHSLNAPVLTPQTLQELRKNPAIIQNMKHSFHVMLEFYGLSYNPDSKTVTKDNFQKRSKVWLLDPQGHHNFLRITRILNCLKLMGLQEEAGAFLKALEEIAKNNHHIISQNTLGYWRNALL